LIANAAGARYEPPDLGAGQPELPEGLHSAGGAMLGVRVLHSDLSVITRGLSANTRRSYCILYLCKLNMSTHGM
jgi:hypothetical protein